MRHTTVSGSHTGLGLILPEQGEQLALDAYAKAGATWCVQVIGGSTVYVFDLNAASPPPVPTPKRSSSEILEEMLAALPAEKRQQAQRQIAGIVGALFGADGRSARNSGELHHALKARFIAREGLAQIVEHPSFDAFVQARAHELFLRLATEAR